MHKKIFAACFFAACLFVFVAAQAYFIYKDLNVFTIPDRESQMEKIFSHVKIVKEIYGFSNNLISPNERVAGSTTVVKDDDGYMQNIYCADAEAVEEAKSKIVELNTVCRENGTDFLFVFYPSKNNAQTTATTYGIETNFETVRKNFLTHLDSEKIDYLNVRQLFEIDGYNVKDIFYKTDHHWKTTAGLYAARAIANSLNSKYSWNLDTSALDEEKFTYTTYNNIWFGEAGRQQSLTWVNALDDFILIMPNYETSISQLYPDGREKSGDFSIMVDTSGYTNSKKDLYKYSAHYSYSKGMESPVTYHNNMISDCDKKILIIMDSYSVVVIPFLTLSVPDITVWDMRNDATKEGLYQFIADNDFDAVVLAYTDFWRSNMWSFN